MSVSRLARKYIIFRKRGVKVMFFTFCTKNEEGEYRRFTILAVYKTGAVKGPNRVVLLLEHQ